MPQPIVEQILNDKIQPGSTWLRTVGYLKPQKYLTNYISNIYSTCSLKLYTGSFQVISQPKNQHNYNVTIERMKMNISLPIWEGYI